MVYAINSIVLMQDKPTIQSDGCPRTAGLEDPTKRKMALTIRSIPITNVPNTGVFCSNSTAATQSTSNGKLPTMQELRKKRAAQIPPLPPQTTALIKQHRNQKRSLVKPRKRLEKRFCDARRALTLIKQEKPDANGSTSSWLTLTASASGSPTSSLRRSSSSSPSSTCCFDQHQASDQSDSQDPVVRPTTIGSVLHLIQQAQRELKALNSQRSQVTKIHPVFGWSHCIWESNAKHASLQGQQQQYDQENVHATHQMVNWKAAKVFTCLDVGLLTQTIWQVNPHKIQKHFPSIHSIQVVFQIDAHTQIVRVCEQFGERQPQTSFWIKFMGKDPDQRFSCICWKQINPHQHGNGDAKHQSKQMQPTSEVRGYFLREHLTKMNGKFVRGCVLHSICSLNTRNKTTEQFVQSLCNNLPTLTLQWEEVYTQDLETQGSLHSLFASGF